MGHAVWEYLILPEAQQSRLSSLGEEGWELVGIGGGAEALLYLKRPGASFRERVTLEQRDRHVAAPGRDPHGNSGESAA